MLYTLNMLVYYCSILFIYLVYLFYKAYTNIYAYALPYTNNIPTHTCIIYIDAKIYMHYTNIHAHIGIQRRPKNRPGEN